MRHDISSSSEQSSPFSIAPSNVSCKSKQHKHTR
jgi:hypothetical protein